MPGGGGDHSSRGAIVAIRERERQVVQAVIRGLTFGEIARQLGMGDESTARKAFNRAIKRFPPSDVELLRKLQSERLNDARRRIYSGLAGREREVPDPANPGQTKRVLVQPTLDEVNASVDRILKIEAHEADLYGLYAPKKSETVSAIIGQPISDEELDRQLARLTEEEQETFMMLLQKLQGRWVEPPPASIETTASPVSSLLGIEPPKNGSGESNG
jgi:hypothetical protein